MKKIICLVVVYLFTFQATLLAADVKLFKNAFGWQMMLDDQPFLIKGMNYSPTDIKDSLENNTRKNWMNIDNDKDFRNDYAFQSWVDFNKNNRQDPGEEEEGDFPLMKRMGVNTVRIYHHQSKNSHLVNVNKNVSLWVNSYPKKDLLNNLHKEFGMWFAMGDLLGAYQVGSGANSENGTDYTDWSQLFNMMFSVEDMVMHHKDEPYLLMWVLGDGNNNPVTTQTNANENLIQYAKFINWLTNMIHSLDDKHPVCLVHSGIENLDVLKEYAPDVDIIGIVDYPNEYGYGDLWQTVKDQYDRPIVVMDIGAKLSTYKEGRMDEEVQRDLHQYAWLDVQEHFNGQKKPGNALGGFVFEWIDEWWYHGEPDQQNYNDNMKDKHHEYSGLCSLGNGDQGSFMRQLRKVYFMYTKLWKEK